MTKTKIPQRRYLFDFESDTAVGEIKSQPKAIRQVRDALVKLIKRLVQSPDKSAYLVLIDPQISRASLEDELNNLKAAMRSEVAGRLHLVVVVQQRIEGLPANISPSDIELLNQKIEESAVAFAPLPRPDMQSEVLKVLIHQWALDQGAMTFDWLSNTVGCTYRTVANMVEALGPAIDRSTDQGIKLKYFPRQAWAQFMARSRKSRATADYVDRSGQPHSPESLVKRLMSLDRDEVAVGGVLGASHYYPKLDMVSAPRLDLSVHVRGKHADLEFVGQLDPGLERVDVDDRPTPLVLHFVRRKESLFSKDDKGILWADPIECLADLQEARLDQQATEFESYLLKRRGAVSDTF